MASLYTIAPAKLATLLQRQEGEQEFSFLSVNNANIVLRPKTTNDGLKGCIYIKVVVDPRQNASFTPETEMNMSWFWR